MQSQIKEITDYEDFLEQKSEKEILNIKDYEKESKTLAVKEYNKIIELKKQEIRKAEASLAKEYDKKLKSLNENTKKDLNKLELSDNKKEKIVKDLLTYFKKLLK